jgi:hypothetical protein
MSGQPSATRRKFTKVAGAVAAGGLFASTPTGENLKAVVRSDTNVAVGAGGTVLEF